MDETYVKVNGRWVYLYRAVDQRGHTIDFYLSSRSNTKAAYCFLGKILNNVKQGQIPRVINMDKTSTYGCALSLLKQEGNCLPTLEHRQIKYHNNVIECDHGKLKRIIILLWSASKLFLKGDHRFRFLFATVPTYGFEKNLQISPASVILWVRVSGIFHGRCLL